MAVLTLDLAWSCGWCLWRQGDRVESGVRDFKAAGGRDGARLYAFRLFLTATLNTLKAAGEALNDVAFESVDFFPAKNGVNAAHIYGALWGNLETWCEHYKIPCRGINVSTIKKHVTGHGSAAKPLVTKRVQELFPHVRQHDEADAVAVLLTAQNKFPFQPEAAR